MPSPDRQTGKRNTGMTGRIDRTGGGMALSRAPAADREALSAQRLSQSPAPAGMAAPAGGVPGYVPGVHSGYWVVDPGVHKQSQDWVYVGPVPRRAAPPRRPWWPVTLAAALAGLACLLAAAGALLARVAGLSPATLIRNPLF